VAGRKIEVNCYSGFKGEQTPRAFSIEGKGIEVIEIMRMWIEEGYANKERKRFFEVRGSDGKKYTLYYDEKANDWFY